MKVDKKESFFVGDAAGRGKDHGKSDKEFAANCGLTFYTEEEFFLKDVLGSKEKKWGLHFKSYINNLWLSVKKSFFIILCTKSTMIIKYFT